MLGFVNYIISLHDDGDYNDDGDDDVVRWHISKQKTTVFGNEESVKGGPRRRLTTGDQELMVYN